MNSTFNRRIDVFSIPLQIGDGAFVDAVESILETEFYEDEDKLSCWEYLTRRFVEAQESGGEAGVGDVIVSPYQKFILKIRRRYLLCFFSFEIFF